MEILTGIMIAILIFYSGKLIMNGQLNINNNNQRKQLQNVKILKTMETYFHLFWKSAEVRFQPSPQVAFGLPSPKQIMTTLLNSQNQSKSPLTIF